MNDLRLFAAELAQVLTEYSSPVQPGDYVTVVGNGATCAPLIEALTEAILRRGGIPNLQTSVMLSPDYCGYFELYLRLAGEQQLGFVDPTMLAWAERSDAIFFLKAPANTKALSAIDPDRIAEFRQGLQTFQKRYMARYDAGELRWTVVGWPTEALAQTAEMNLLEYTQFVYRACGLDQFDPVAYWQRFRAEQERLTAWLADKKHAEVRGPGIEMAFDFAGRPWVSSHGEQNFPDGEIFTSPVEDSVNGHVEFNYPCVYLGNEVEGVRLVFKDGRAVEANAERGEAFLLKMLDSDEGARRLGEFAIGTNQAVDRMTRSILFDEKIGGSIHMALGRSYKKTGGVNESAIHWDMVHNMQDGGEIIVDGIPFYRAGKFLV